MKFYRQLYLALVLSFILGVQDGNIALWKKGSPEPITVFPYRADSLPEADRKALEQGIELESRQDLLELMEDYLS